MNKGLRIAFYIATAALVCYTALYALELYMRYFAI